MSDVIERVRKKYPEYDKVSDEELTYRVGKKYPEYLKRDPQFNEDYKNIDRRVRKIQLEHEMREVRKQGLRQELAIDLQFPEPTEEGSAATQLGYGLYGGLVRTAEGMYKIAESGERALGNERRANYWKKMAAERGEIAADIDTVARATKGAPFARSLGQGVTSLAPTLVAAPTGPWGMAIAAGAQSYGQGLADAERAYKAQGLSDEEAFKKAQGPALLQGLGTALITRGFMKAGGGFEEALLMSAVGRATFKEIAKGVFKHGGLEATEESWNQLYDSIVRKATYQPDLTFEEAIEQIGEAGEIGGILGASMYGVRQIDAARQGKAAAAAESEVIKTISDAEALERSMPAGFAGEPEATLDTPKWKEAGTSLLEGVPLPEKLGKGETYTVKFKNESGQDGVIEFGDQATRLTIERGLAASGAKEITEVNQFTPPTEEEAKAAEPAPEPAPVAEPEPEPAPVPETQEEVEDDYEVTPEEAAMEAEAYGDEVAQDVEPEPVAKPVMDRSDFLLLPEERHEEEVDILFSLLEKAEEIVAKEFEELKLLAETHPDQLSEMDRTLIERGENPNNYQQNDHVVYRMADNGNQMPYYHSQLYTGQIKEEKVAVAHKFLDLLAQEQPKYQRLIAEDELNKFNARQNRLTKDLLGRLETEDDPADDSSLPRQIAKFPPRAKPKEPTIADVPDAERNFADRDLRQFSGIDRTLAEISRVLRTKKNTLVGQKPYKGLTKLQGFSLKKFNDAIDAYGFLLNKDTTTSEQLQEAATKIYGSYIPAVQEHLEEFGLPKLDERELRGIAFPRQTTEQTDERIEDDGSPVVEQQAGTSEGDGTGATEAPLGEQRTDGTPRPDDEASARPVSDTPEQGATVERGEGDRASGDRESRSGEGRDRATTGEPTASDRGVGGQPEQLNNYVIPEGEETSPTGKVSKARANIEAIKLLKQLEQENRAATSDEQKVLAQYSGWGPIQEAFSTKGVTGESESWDNQWKPIYEELHDLLDHKEYIAARKSLLNAHYTSTKVIGEMWKGLRHLGFKGGRVLEPSAGVGHFFGMMPQDMASNSRLWGVELDPISARILSKLYPNAQTFEGGFQDANIKNNSMDLVIGNVPFAKEGVQDSRYPDFSLHNYFFARSVDALKPGGLMVAITSESTMDAPISKEAREYIAERADLVGAIRLPNTAFKENAQTEVTTDILVFRKKTGQHFKQASDFVDLVIVKTQDGNNKDRPVNEYYAKKPEMLLGRLSLEGKLYGRPGKQRTLLPFEPEPELPPLIEEAFQKMPRAVVAEETHSYENETEFVEADKEVVGRVGALVQVPDAKSPKLTHLKIQGENTLLDLPKDAYKNSAQLKRLNDYVVLKNAAQAMVRSELDPEKTTEELDVLRKNLNAEYDKYFKKHGSVNGRKSAFIWQVDVDFQQVAGLENVRTEFVEQTKDGVTKVVKKDVVSKMPIFDQRTNFPRKAPATAETPADALTISMSYKNHVDENYVGQLLNTTPEGARAKLLEEELVFENPISGLLETPSEYLSGNVKRKLKEVQAAVESQPELARNVTALTEVQPEPVPFEQIGFRLGSTWIDPMIVSRFLRETLDVSVDVHFVKETGKWKLNVFNKFSETNQQVYGYPDGGLDGLDLAQFALNLKEPTVYDPPAKGEKKGKKNPQKTMEAGHKVEELKAAFKEWASNDQEAAKFLYETYNENFNGTRLREYDEPDFDYYPGATTELQLRPHQKRAVSRILQGSTLLAHAVGTGKTFIMATAAMEMKRLGMANKPMIVVLNSTLEQFGREFKQLYPAANIMVPSRKQRDAKNRQRTMAQIATGNWDSVIIPQSFLDMLPDDPKREAEYMEKELVNLATARIKAAQEEGKSSPKVKDLVKAEQKLEKRIEELKSLKIKDRGMTFEETGVDALLVDEAHRYKKLQFQTQMGNIRGIDTSASKRGLSMLMKARWVQENNDGKNVVMATGTPISNTVAEAWTFMRYISPKLVKEYGMENFDSFASLFGDTVSGMELTAAGTWKVVQRFAKYSNGYQLITAFRTIADVITQEEVPDLNLPPLKGGEPTNIVIPQTDGVAEEIASIREDLEKYDQMSGEEKRANPIPLTTNTRAKKASIDIRLINPLAEEEVDSKLNRAIDKIMEIYHAEQELQGTQLVFCDTYQSHVEGLTDEQQFNVYDEIKSKLVAAGVPSHEIVAIGPKTTDAQKKIMGEGIKSGEVRIAIGSTEKLGTGLNVQDRMAALHHLDAPVRPMDIEQRNGRILRQGNLYGQRDENQNLKYGGVEIVTYGMENTLDAVQFQKLAMKQKFVNQLLRGDLQSSEFEDAANEASLTFEEQMAAFSGDPAAIQRVALDHEIRSLEASRKTFINSKRDAATKLKEVTEEKIPLLERQIKEAKEIAEKMPSSVEEIDGLGRVTTDPKKFSKEFDRIIAAALVDAHESARKKGYTIKSAHFTKGPTLQINGFEVTTSVKGTWDGKNNDWVKDTTPQLQWRFTHKLLEDTIGAATTGVGLLSSLNGKIKPIANLPAIKEATLARAKRDKVALEDTVDKEWPKQAEYDKAQGDLARLDEELRERGKDKQEIDDAVDRGNEALDQEEKPKGMQIKPRPGGGQGGFIRLDVIRDLGIKGKDLFKKGFTVFAGWAKAMKSVFGDRVGKYLDQVWNRVKRDEFADENNLSPDGVAAKHRIEGTEKVDEEEKPNYATPLKTRLLEPWRRQSTKIVYYGSEQLLREKQGVEMMGMYQAAAIKQQADTLEKKLWESRPDESGWSLPDFLRKGAWASRIKEFKGKALPLAAHLNVTGIDEDKKFIFTDFEMRAGIMSAKQFEKGEHNVGDVIMVKNPLTGEQDQLVIDNFIRTRDKSGYQLLREMPADLQEELYNHYTQVEYPEFAWFIDTFIDPGLKDVRQEVAGIEVPVFNRFSLASMLAEGTGEFNAIDAYTPDVVVSRSLWGAARQALRLRSGVRSAGRRYKTGKSREEGKVLDLLSGFNVRALQAAQEKSRKRWLKSVVENARSFKGETPPEGYVDLESGLTEIWKAIKAVRGWNMPVDPKTGERVFPETEDRLQEKLDKEAFEAFKKEAFKLAGGKKAIPKPLMDALVKQYAQQQSPHAILKVMGYLLRQSKGLFLFDPVTVVGNLGANEFFALEAEFHAVTSGMIKAMSGDLQGAGQKLRFARNLFAGQLINRFIGARKYLPGRIGKNSHYLDAIQTVLPDELFADSTRLSDFNVRFDQKWHEMLRQGELAGAALQMIQYGNIDVRAKQRVAYAMLKASAVTKGRAKKLRGRDLRAYVTEYMKNPPVQDRLQAVNAAQFEMLNYADSPDYINKLVTNDFGALISPFPRFGAAFAAKQKDRLSALKLFMGKVPKGKRADAFADILTVGMFGFGASGAVVMALRALLGDEEEDDPRSYIGSATKIVDKGYGPERERFDTELITANRMNLSYWARLAGIDDGDDTDFWMRTRQYPTIGMAGALIMGWNDAKRYGADVGLQTWGQMVGELGGEFISFGAGIRVPFKFISDFQSGFDRPAATPVDPFAGSVPFSFYVTDELMGSFIPGQRQFDRLISYVDPIYRRPTRSKELGYDPGVIEAFRASHFTGLLDRIAVQQGLIDPLPPRGAVETVSKFPSFNLDFNSRKRSELFEESRRSQTTRDYSRFTKRQDRYGGEYLSQQNLNAFIPEENIRRMPWETQASSLGGFNIRPYPRSEIEEALQSKQLPVRPSLLR